MKKFLQYTGRILIFTILTIVTQIGGILYIFSNLISRKLSFQFKFKGLVTFLVVYLFATFLIVPFVAPIFGKEKVTRSSKLKPVNYLTVLLNRNYVTPELNDFLISTENELKKIDNRIEIRYLDACFPFIDGFPLLPHLSHNNGNKIDLSLIYEDQTGQIRNDSKSISGYGVFVEPLENEFHQTEQCKEKGYFQYDYPKYLTFGKINSDFIFSLDGTRKLIVALLDQKDLGKIFIEPHLKTRMNLNDNKIRFQGCRAVRHDDHIHIQLK